MPSQHSRVSFQNWKSDTWECFNLIEENFPLKKIFYFPNEDLWFESFFRIIYPTSLAINFNPDELNKFTLFILFLFKSTLLFDLSFILPLQDKNAKLSLMEADLYLVQGGKIFSSLNHYQRCIKLLESTLQKISRSHLVLFHYQKITQDIKKHICRRYGAIYYCAIKALFLLNNTHSCSSDILWNFSKQYALWINLQYHPYMKLSFAKDRTTILEQYRTELETYYQKNHKELKFIYSTRLFT